MLKSAAAKLAHNSTIPALAGNKALRPLQDLITAEKAIITSLSRLSLHFSQASEALRNWGLGEGDDLLDTLGASTKLLLEFSSSLKQFAMHEKTIREHMKSIRTQEERLDQLKNRRKSVSSKADSAERKLNRMETGHKDTATQSTLLEGLRNAMRELDSDIMTGEARLGDLKRTSAKVWMTLKFGAMQECCRKGIIVAEAGNLIMAELPQLVTEPGLARPFYTGSTRTEAYVTEATRALGDISIDAFSSSGPLHLPLLVNYHDGAGNTIPSALPDNDSLVSMGRGELPGDGESPSQYRGQYGYGALRPSLGERNDYDQLPTASRADEHGGFLPPPDAARFRSLSTRKPPPVPFPKPHLRDDLPSSSQGIGLAASSGGRFATFPVKGRRQGSVGHVILDGSRPPLSDVEQTSQKEDPDDIAAPNYEAAQGLPAPPLGPPPGAAPPAMLHTSLYPGSYHSGPSFDPDNTVENEDDTQLPYMSPRERKVPFGSRPPPVPRPWLSPGNDVESSEEPHGRAPMSTESDAFPDPVQTPSASTQALNTAPTLPAAVEDPDDERALNAAAAREVSRELDSLMYHPPTRDLPPPALAPPTPNTPPAMSPRSSSDSVIPASSPPFARARGRVSGSPSVPRSSLERPSPTNGPPSPSGASTPVHQAQLPPPSIMHARPSSPSLSSVNNTSFRTPPELPPSPSPASSQRSLPPSPGVSFSPGKAPPPPPPPPRQGSGMISVAAFRRPPPPPVNPRDVNPLSIKKKEVRSSPNAPRTGGPLSPTSSMPGALPPHLSPSLPQEQRQDDEFDYISAYYSAGADEAGSPPSYTESRARSGSLR